MRHSPPVLRLNNLFSFTLCLLVTCLALSALASAAPSIALSRRSGPPTTRILVSGEGFAPNVGVDIYFDTKDEALVVTNSQGEFKDTKIEVLRSATPGEHWVTALERNNDTGAQESFLVQTDWRQFRFSPTHQADNPFENVISPKTVGSLGVKWIYNPQQFYTWGSPIVVNGTVYTETWNYMYSVDAITGAANWVISPPLYDMFYSNPAIVDGVLYIGLFDEGLLALNANTGATLWLYQCTVNTCRVNSSPAVAYGIVYFADAERSGDGVYAVNAKTGNLVWFTVTSSSFSSAAVANGMVYIGADDSNVYALNAFTGIVIWTYTAGDVVRTAPAVANGIVYAGSDDDNMYALNATTGAKVWSYTTGGIVESSPAVVNGVVYFGSDDGNFYALNAYTGDLIWRYATGASYIYDPSVANGVVYFGTAYPDAIYALDTMTGRLLWTYSTGGYVSADPAIVNGVVYMSSYNDGLVYAFAPMNEQASADSKPPAFTTLRPDYGLGVSVPSNGEVGDK